MYYRGIDVFTGTPIELETLNGAIVSVTPTGYDASGLPYLSPGFLDMQVNGFNGNDYSLDDLNSSHIEHIIESLATSGTTRHVPTIITSSQERLVRNLKVIAQVRQRSTKACRAIVGCHIEGPYISTEDGPRGAHDLSYVRNPNFDEFLEWQDASEGLVQIVTIAPERKGAMEFTERVAKTGVVVAIGHTAASPEIITEAIARGCTVSTHLGNGSHARVPRLHNYIWEQLAADELMASVIADGFHLPPAVLKTFARAKGLERLVLVSDVALPGGYAPGQYKWGKIDVEVFEDGHIGLPGTKFLAGAGHLLDWDIPMFMRCTGANLGQTVGLCTKNPMKLLFPSDDEPKLAVGRPANLVQFRYDPAAPRLRILETILDGEVIFESGQV